MEKNSVMKFIIHYDYKLVLPPAPARILSRGDTKKKPNPMK